MVRAVAAAVGLSPEIALLLAAAVCTIIGVEVGVGGGVVGGVLGGVLGGVVGVLVDRGVLGVDRGVLGVGVVGVLAAAALVSVSVAVAYVLGLITPLPPKRDPEAAPAVIGSTAVISSTVWDTSSSSIDVRTVREARELNFVPLHLAGMPLSAPHRKLTA
jgi:hypothetical protein